MDSESRMRAAADARRERRRRARRLIKRWLLPYWWPELLVEGWDVTVAALGAVGLTRRNAEILATYAATALVAATLVGGCGGQDIATVAGGSLVFYLMPGPSRRLVRRLWRLARYRTFAEDEVCPSAAHVPAAIREAEEVARQSVDEEHARHGYRQSTPTPHRDR